MATPFLSLELIVGLIFNSQKCDNTFVNWYNSYEKRSINQTKKERRA